MNPYLTGLYRYEWHSAYSYVREALREGEGAVAVLTILARQEPGIAEGVLRALEHNGRLLQL